MLLSRRAALAWGLAVFSCREGRAWSSTSHVDGPIRASEVEKVLWQHRIPGAGLAILDARGSIAAYGYGVARAATSVSKKTRFQAASISKTLNALLTLTLVRDGLVSLDDPVNKQLKSYALSGRDADRVTPRMLLSHTGGTSVRGFAGYERGRPLPSLHQILAGEAPANSVAIKVVSPLGRFAYSGGGIMMLQQMIIDVTGQAYEDAATTRVLAPLSMSDSSFEQPPSGTNESDIAHAHTLDGLPVPNGYNIYPEMAAAGLWTTPLDLCRMMHGIATSLAGGHSALLPQAIAEQMVIPVNDVAALGVFAGKDGTIGHGGRNRGFSAAFRLSLNSGRGVAVMTNRHDAQQALQEMMERGFAHEQ